MKKVVIVALTLMALGCGHGEVHNQDMIHGGITDFSGGINDSNDPQAIRSNQLSDALNMALDGASLVKRAGMQNYPTTQSITDRCVGLGELRTRGLGNFKIGLFGDGKAYYVAGGAWTAVSGATGLNTASPWSIIKTENNGYDTLILSNFEDVPKTYGFSATATLLEGCEDAGLWTAIDSAIISNVTGTKTQGNQSIKITKGAPATTTGAHIDLGTTYDGTALGLYVDFASMTVYLNNLKETGAVTFYISDQSDYSATYYKTYDRADISNVWQTYGGALASWSTTGSPDITKLRYLKVEVEPVAGPPHAVAVYLDNWRLIGSAIPTWGNLAGTPPRVKYLETFGGYLWGFNGKDNSDDTLLYPHLGYRANTIADPETMDGTNSYDFYDEITGPAKAGGVMVVFTKSGIHEVYETGDSRLPFGKRQTRSDFGAFHNTVRAGHGMVIFAYFGGVYGYIPGAAQVVKLGDNNIDNTYSTEVTKAGKLDALSAAYISDTRQYYLAVGDTSLNDKLLVFNFDEKGWLIYSNAATGWDVKTIVPIYDDDGVIVPWIGSASGHTMIYGEHITQQADEEQDGTDINMTAFLKSGPLAGGNWATQKVFSEGQIKGLQNSSGAITLKVYADGASTGTTVGTLDLYTTDDWMTARFRPYGGNHHGHSFIIELTEAAGASADTRWRIDQIDYFLDVLGVY